MQQFADVDPGPDAKDPFCGIATYDGHDGIDLRIRSMSDVAHGVPVIAMQSGMVLRIRTGVSDHVVATADDEAAVRDRECGNGVVVEQTDGLEAQYCHLKLDSVRVKPGQSVAKGETLGHIGASGLAQFPHVHVTVRRHGAAIDLMSGQALAEGCGHGTSGSLFPPAVVASLGDGQAQLLDFGVTEAAVREDALVANGRPADATTQSSAVVAWAWLINLAQGESLTVTLIGPDGQAMSTQEVPPFARKKSTYVAFAGKKRTPFVGDYKVHVVLSKDGMPVIDQTRTVGIR